MWPFKRKDPATKAIMHQRKFAAAQYGTLLSNWNRAKVEIDSAVKQGGAALRERSRESSRNNDYARKYLNMLQTNVVGKNGIRLQAQSRNAKGGLDSTANEMVEAAWGDFNRAIDVTGKLSGTDLQNLVITNTARDGEILLRHVVGFPNAFGYAVQLLDPAQLDEQHNQELKNGNTIRLGIEFDGWGRPVAYHLTQNSKIPGSYTFEGRERMRIPADEIVHAFRAEYCNQSRGFTWMCAALVEMYHLAAFQEAAIIAARIGASTMGFFTETLGGEFAGGADSKQGNDLAIDVEPGSFRRLPAGLDFKIFESKYPSDMVDSFIKRSIKSIAAGLNVSYNSLAADPESTSYGTLRSFSIEERDNYRALQQWVSQAVMAKIYPVWLRQSLLTRAIRLPADRYEKLLDVKWQARGWQWIDPAKDATAYETLLRNKLTAPSILAAEQGRDFEEVCRQIAADNEIMKKYGLTEAADANQTT